MLGVRSLVRRGVRTTSFESELHPDYPGFRSKYGRAHACPDPDVDPSGWVEFMVDLAKTMGEKPVLIASADQFVSAIATHGSRLTTHFILSPGIALQGLLATKQTQYDLAVRHGMPIPRTQPVHSEEDLRRFAETASFPCILKPIHFREWQAFPAGHPLSYEKVTIAETLTDLLAKWRLAATANPHTVVQEIILGPDTSKRVYLSCYDRSGKRIAYAMLRELRCDPLGFGPPTVQEPILDSAADQVGDHWLRSMGYTGICELEMKWDSRDGRLKLIEANPRLTGGGDAAPYAGVDTCWLHYLDLIGKEVTPVSGNGRDFRHIFLRSDVAAIAAYRRAGLISWGDVFRSYRPPLAFYDFDRRDWRYSLETIYRFARSVAGALVRWVLRRQPKDPVAVSLLK